MKKLILITLISGSGFALGCLTQRAYTAHNLEQFLSLYADTRKLTKDLHSLQIESTCIQLGISARRGLKNDRDTALFEGLGCCYNDGLKEPTGC